jgi:hypothetical protein
MFEGFAPVGQLPESADVGEGIVEFQIIAWSKFNDKYPGKQIKSRLVEMIMFDTTPAVPVFSPHVYH